MASQSPLQILHNLQTLGLCSDLEVDDSNSLQFDRILAAFYMDVHKNTDARPLPAVIAGGRPVDLFRLFSAVQERGGFDSVSAVSGWGAVAQETGFELEFVSSVKLVYFKYLEVLEKSLRRVPHRCVEVEVTQVEGSGNGEFSPSSGGLKKEHFLLPGRRLRFENDDCDVLVLGKVEGNESGDPGDSGGVSTGKVEGNGSGDLGNCGSVISGKIEGKGSGYRGNCGDCGGVVSGKGEGNGSGDHGDCGGVVSEKLEGNGSGDVGNCGGVILGKVEGNGSGDHGNCGDRGGVVSGKGEENGSGDLDNCGGVISEEVKGNGGGDHGNCGDRGGVVSGKGEESGSGDLGNCGGVISGKVKGNGGGDHGNYGDRGGLVSGKGEENGSGDLGNCGGVISGKVKGNGDGDRGNCGDRRGLVSGKGEGTGSGDLGNYGGVISGKVVWNGSGYHGNGGDRGGVVSGKGEGNGIGYPGGGNGSVGLHKRKRDEMGAMLEWIRKVAKKPTDCSFADVVSPEKGKVKSCMNRDLFSQIVRARRGMFQNIGKGILESNIQRGSRLRSAEVNGVHNLHESSMQLTPGSYAKTLIFSNHDKNTNGQFAAKRENSEARQRLRSSSLNFDQVAGSLFGDQNRNRVPVGPQFQAEVPTWTGKPALPCTDHVELKWLGAKIWPPENQENKLLLKCNSTGRSQLDHCHCKKPGSVECIRSHIAERRLRLKRELGPAFYAWGFESMGEEVAVSWTVEEERKFKAIVRLYRPSLNKNFWDQLPLCFPFKGRRKLASYYYNVFLLRRRSYQNHVTPYITDSDDDDESECGFLSSHIV